MNSRGALTVLLALALLHNGYARPGNDIQEAPKQTNEITKDVHVKSEDNKATLTANKESDITKIAVVKDTAAVEKLEDTITVEAAKQDPTKIKESKTEVTKAVNELFPHAVLFGGTCGGTIISPKWILTAGHCTIFSSGRYILAGTNRSDDGTGIERRVKRLILHPKFSVGPYWVDANQFNIKQVAADWDFMLVELEEALPLDGKIMAAAELNDQPELPAGLVVGYAGYGAEHHGEYMRNEMHGMELEVQKDAMCSEALVEYEPKTMICTKGRAPRYDSACNGDSGSGLVANGKVYGVASWVQDDSHRCFNGALVIFSRVSTVRDWIRQVTKI